MPCMSLEQFCLDCAEEVGRPGFREVPEAFDPIAAFALNEFVLAMMNPEMVFKAKVNKAYATPAIGVNELSKLILLFPLAFEEAKGELFSGQIYFLSRNQN